jgi:hypothetical protein
MAAPKDRTDGVTKLVIAALLSAAYIGAILLMSTSTILHGTEGIAVLGLYVSSLPARHFLELLIYGRVPRRFQPRGALSVWLALNTFVLLCGWLVIVVGVIRFTRFSS